MGIAYCVGISGPAPTSTACASSSAATSTATTITTSSPTITIEPQPDIPYFAVQLTLDNAPYHVAGNGSIVTDLSDAGILYIEDGSLFNVDGGYVSADPFDDPVYVVLAETRNDYVFSTTFFLHEVNQNSGKIGGNGNDTQALKRQSGTESYILQWENEAFAEPDLLAIFCVSDGYVYAVLVNAPIPSSCVTVDLGIVEGNPFCYPAVLSEFCKVLNRRVSTNILRSWLRGTIRSHNLDTRYSPFNKDPPSSRPSPYQLSRNPNPSTIELLSTWRRAAFVHNNHVEGVLISIGETKTALSLIGPSRAKTTYSCCHRHSSQRPGYSSRDHVTVDSLDFFHPSRINTTPARVRVSKLYFRIQASDFGGR